MKKLIYSLIFMSQFSCAYDVDISNGESIDNGSVKNTCKFSGVLKRDDDSVIQLTASGVSYTLVDSENMSDFKSVQIFDIDNDGFCELMVGTGQGDVNDSYALFVSNNGEFIRSKLPTVYNPDIKEGMLTLKYREEAKTYGDDLCYSKERKDFYLCRREVSLIEDLNSVNYFNEYGVKVKSLVSKSDGTPAYAVVVVDKSIFGDLTDTFEFKEKKSYLVKGDKVEIIDYAEHQDEEWFKVVYRGKKAETVGWMLSSSF